jgi:hypothetical protein
MTTAPAQTNATPDLKNTTSTVTAGSVEPISQLPARIASGNFMPVSVTATSGTYSVSLANGFKMEVMAICRNPRNSTQWWRPDGTLFDAPPYEIINIEEIKPTRGPEVTIVPENEILIAVREAGHGGPGFSIEQNWAPQPSDIEFPPTLLDKTTGKKFSAALICFENDVQTSMTYTVKVPYDKWEKIASFDGVKTHELLDDVMIVCEKPAVPEGEQYTRFDIMHNVDRANYAMRMTAHLKNGRSVEVDFHDGVFTGSPAKGFAIIQASEDWLPADVVEYTIERSPILEGSIPHIALAPGSPVH